MPSPPVIRGIEFSLYYDYDQLRDGKLGNLTNHEKLQWFVARHDRLFLRPLRAFWQADSSRTGSIFQALIPPYRRMLSFKLGMFGALLNIVESMGGFLDPAIPAAPGGNWKRFETFSRLYMKAWDAKIARAGGATDDLLLRLWQGFRNPIAHEGGIKAGGLEYLPQGTRFTTSAGWLQICPRQYMQDYVAGFSSYLSQVRGGGAEFTNFIIRFNAVFPS